ncbi:hypothetical protein IWW50_006228 [Coemansia erecta]|nr:hypothetical protein GGF43_000264 [Coemansia sp. RSA 2618]KAJ2817265.1 hypothetical protein IWW50_006228 [Coemansia erecta]
MSSRTPTNKGGRQLRTNSRRDDSPDVKLSKLLSYLLRHGAAKEGMHMRDDGSIALSELKKHKQLHTVPFDRIKHIVDTNDKKRYMLFQEDATWFIRASQGHSMQVKQLPLEKLTLDNMPEFIIHGTRSDRIAAIREKGLSKMNRNHIHFATGLATDANVVSGMRATSDVLIYIDKAKAVGAGIEFLLSDNGVVLSEGLDKSGVIPSEYFEKIVLR